MKRGVSLYSFQEEYFRKELSLEGCVAAAADMGAPGIEIVSEQMVFGFPRVDDGFYSRWKQWMEKYHTVALAHDMNLDTKRFPGRLLTQKEMVDWTVLNLRYAARMGFKNVRANQVTPPEIWKDILPVAEELGLNVGVELHPPFTFRHPRILQHLEEMERLGSPRLGLVVDTGIFEKRYSRVKKEYYIRHGASQRWADYIEAAYNAGESGPDLWQKVEELGGEPKDVQMARETGRMVYTPPGEMKEHARRILWLHAKFYEMTEDGEEYSIPFDEIVEALNECGFDGYLCSEYEGNRYIQDLGRVDSITQVKRQQAMLKRLLGQ